MRSARLKILSGEFMGRRLAFVLLVVLSLVSIALPAGAVTNGTYDGNNHPYVGYADNLVLLVYGHVAIADGDADCGALLQHEHVGPGQ